MNRRSLLALGLASALSRFFPTGSRYPWSWTYTPSPVAAYASTQAVENYLSGYVRVSSADLERAAKQLQEAGVVFYEPT